MELICLHDSYGLVSVKSPNVTLIQVRMFGFINVVDKVIWPPQRDSSAEVSCESPSSERVKELWVVCRQYHGFFLWRFVLILLSVAL